VRIKLFSLPILPRITFPVISLAAVNPSPEASENRMTNMNLGGYVGTLLAFAGDKGESYTTWLTVTGKE